MGQGGVDSGLSGLKCVHLFGYRTTVQEFVKHNTLQTNLLLSAGGGAVVASMIVCDSASRLNQQMFTFRWCETFSMESWRKIRSGFHHSWDTFRPLVICARMITSSGIHLLRRT